MEHTADEAIPAIPHTQTPTTIQTENQDIQAFPLNLDSHPSARMTLTTSKQEYEICSLTATLQPNKPHILIDPLAVVAPEVEEEAVCTIPLPCTEHSHHHNTQDIEIHGPTVAKLHGITVKISLPMPLE
jgi:hypothetical protein